jgi:hypothetical protein
MPNGRQTKMVDGVAKMVDDIKEEPGYASGIQVTEVDNASTGLETTGGCPQKTVPGMACQK